MTDRVWFVTGAGRGLGRAFVDAVLERGDRVVATARTPESLRRDLAAHGDRAIVLQLDVADRAAVQSTVTQAIEEAGHLDVVINNAGYGLSGGVEEITESQARAQFDTNFFGAMWVTQAVLPHFRSRQSGHIIQISSLAGVISSANLGIYCASKWALEAMSEALAAEVAPFGINVSIVEPSGFRTDWSRGSMERAAPLASYDTALEPIRQALSMDDPRPQPGDPVLAARALVDIASNGAPPPLRIPFGNQAYDVSIGVLQSRVEALRPWEDLARSVDSVDVG